MYFTLLPKTIPTGYEPGGVTIYTRGTVNSGSRNSLVVRGSEVAENGYGAESSDDSLEFPKL